MSKPPLSLTVWASLLSASMSLTPPGLGFVDETGPAQPDSTPKVCLVILDRDTGEPLAGASILVPRDGSAGTAAGAASRTDSDGSVCVAVPRAGTVLQAERAGYAGQAIHLAPPTAEKQPARKAFLTPLASLEVRVTAAGALPPDALVVWRKAGGEATEQRLSPDGRWSGTVGVSGDGLDVVVTGTGFTRSCERIPRLKGGLTSLDMQLGRPIAARLLLRGPAERPVEAARFRWLSDGAAKRCPGNLGSDEVPGTRGLDEARHAWDLGLPTGSGLLIVESEGFCPESIGPLTITGAAAVDLGAVDLRACEAVSGVVKSRKGAALEAVPLRLTDPVDEKEAVARSATDEEGRFSFSVPPGSELVLHAGTPPGPALKRTVRPESRNLELVLGDPASIIGTVRSPSGTAVSGAVVAAFPFDSTRREATLLEQRVQTATDGTFELEGLGAGRWRLEVRTTGLARAVRGPLILEEGMAEKVTVVLSKGVTLEGRVLIEETQEPVRDAIVRLGVPGAGGTQDTSDDQGRFRLEGVPPGLVQVIAEHPTAGKGTAHVDPEEGPKDILLKGTGAIDGVAHDFNGGPLSGVLVEVAGAAMQTYTDSGGAFSFQLVPAGPQRVVLLRGMLGANSAVESRQVEVAPGRSVHVEFGAGVRVVGRVLEGGSPLAGVSITFTRMNEGRPSGNLTDTLATARTDSSGGYLIEGLRSGSYTVGARNSQFAVFRTAEVLEDRVNRVDLLITGGRVRGEITDANTGQPITAARIAAFDPAQSFGVIWNAWSVSDDAQLAAPQVAGQVNVAYTNAAGSFEIAASPGRIRIEASADGYDAARTDLDVTEEAGEVVRLALKPNWQVVGIVRDRWANPVAGAGITAACGVAARATNALTDPDGYFRLPNLQQESCTVLASFAGRGMGLAEGITVEAYRDRVIELTLTRPGSLEVRYLPMASLEERRPALLTPLGFNLEALLALSGLPEVRATTAMTESSESILRFPALPPGTYVLRSPDGARQEAVLVREAEELTVSLTPEGY